MNNTFFFFRVMEPVVWLKQMSTGSAAGMVHVGMSVCTWGRACVISAPSVCGAGSGLWLRPSFVPCPSAWWENTHHIQIHPALIFYPSVTLLLTPSEVLMCPGASRETEMRQKSNQIAHMSFSFTQLLFKWYWLCLSDLPIHTFLYYTFMTFLIKKLMLV